MKITKTVNGIDIVAYEDENGITLSFIDNNGTRQDVAYLEATPQDLTGKYPTKLHLFVWDDDDNIDPIRHDIPNNRL